MNDILEFQSNCERKDAFYCLQPIVVKKMDTGEWELVDGQQRLTTVLLILACRHELVKALEKPTFTMRFETRAKSGEFLKSIDFKQRDANIDYFHICQAYSAIAAWFSERDGSRGLQLLQCLTNDDEYPGGGMKPFGRPKYMFVHTDQYEPWIDIECDAEKYKLEMQVWNLGGKFMVQLTVMEGELPDGLKHTLEEKIGEKFDEEDKLSVTVKPDKIRKRLAKIIEIVRAGD